MPRGVYPRTAKHLAICSKGGKLSPTKFKKGHPGDMSLKGIPTNRVPTSAFKIGSTPWNKGKTHKEDNRIPVGNQPCLGKTWTLTEEQRLKHVGKPGFWKGKKLSREHVRKSLTRREKSSLEIKMEDLINKNNLPYKFVGNGDYFIAGKVPDFINEENKVAIEVYCRKHKNMFKDGGVETWKKQREELFAKEGWKTVFFDETQVKEDIILEQLRDEELTLKGGNTHNRN